MRAEFPSPHIMNWGAEEVFFIDEFKTVIEKAVSTKKAFFWEYLVEIEETVLKIGTIKIQTYLIFISSTHNRIYYIHIFLEPSYFF